MRAKWLWTAVVLAAVTGCGEGRAILNVDIYSFLTGTGGDTLRLTPDPLPPMPPGTSITDSITPVGVNLPGGLGSSLVDTVRVTGNIDVTNPTSSGSLSYAIFLASDPSPAASAAQAPPAARLAAIIKASRTGAGRFGQVSPTQVAAMAPR